MQTIPDTAWAIKNQRQESPRPRVKPNTTGLQKVLIKQVLMIFCCTHRPVPYQSALEKLPPAADWNRYWDPAVRHYEERESPLHHSSQSSGNLSEEAWKECKSQMGWRTPGEHAHPNQLGKAHLSWQRLTQQAQDLRRSADGPWRACYSFQLSVIMGLLSVWTRGSLIPVSALVAFSLLLGCLVQPQCDGFCHSNRCIVVLVFCFAFP